MKHLIIIIFLAINFSSCRENDEVTGTPDTTNGGGGSGSSGGSTGSSSSGSTGAIVGNCTFSTGYKVLYRNPGSVSDSAYRSQWSSTCSGDVGTWSDSTSISCSGSYCLQSSTKQCACYDITVNCSAFSMTDASDCSGL